MNILLVRHGETDWNALNKIQGSIDIPLNENGLAQSKKLSEHIAERYHHVDKVYYSKLKRAKQTAFIINANPIIKTGLEEVNFGLWEGLTWKEVEEKYPIEYSDWFKNRRYTKPPHGESYQEVLERASKAINEIIEENTEDVIIVTHRGVILTLLSYVNKTPFENMSQYKSPNVSVEIINSDAFKHIEYGQN